MRNFLGLYGYGIALKIWRSGTVWIMDMEKPSIKNILCRSFKVTQLLTHFKIHSSFHHFQILTSSLPIIVSVENRYSYLWTIKLWMLSILHVLFKFRGVSRMTRICVAKLIYYALCKSPVEWISISIGYPSSDRNKLFPSLSN